MITRRLPGIVGALLRLGLIALAYYAAARLGLGLALVRGQITPIWPPTGIALVAILVMGPRVWPAITIAALAVNLPIGPNPLSAATIAVGNTLAPLASAWLMRRSGFRLELDRLRDAASIIVLGALAGMAVSASIGSLTLLVAEAIPAAGFAQAWTVWWTGDAMGVLLVAPFLLSLRPRPDAPPLDRRGWVELTALLLAIAIATIVVFQTPLRLEYLVFPLIMVAAFRFRLRGAAPAALIASGVAVFAAVHGTGPFATENVPQKMVTLQVFNIFVALASFVLASYVDTREREEKVSRLYLSARLANQAKTDFLQSAAHELRGPLSVLSGYLTMLAGGGLGRPPAKWRGPLEILTAKTWELNRIMDQLLEISRLESNVIAREQKDVDLRSLIVDAAERGRAKAILVGGAINVELGSKPILVHADASQLGLILDNLINNGLSYTKRTPELTISISAEDDQAVVRVSDNGIGIAEATNDRLFEPFRRGHPEGLDHISGTGLGLYISRQFAEANGGTLAIEKSTPGEGSTFTVSMPLIVAAKTSPDSQRARNRVEPSTNQALEQA